jgi:hypothetical protein
VRAAQQDACEELANYRWLPETLSNQPEQFRRDEKAKRTRARCEISC